MNHLYGLIGIFQIDAVAWLFGGSASIFSRIIYTLVALGASVVNKSTHTTTTAAQRASILIQSYESMCPMRLFVILASILRCFLCGRQSRRRYLISKILTR